MANKPARLLDVGNCDPDHAMIRRMLTENFDVTVDRVMFVNDAIAKMKAAPYDLVLVNRLIFDDGSEGMALLKQAKVDPELTDVPIMMISNFPEAQAASQEAGGVPGFGKKSVNTPQTVATLANYLPKK